MLRTEQIFSMSDTRKRVLILVAAFFSLTCSGLLFGFASIHDIMFEIGAFRELCPIGWTSTDPCLNQQLSLDLLFTIGTAATNFVALPAGIFLDKFGPRLTGSLAGGCVCIGVFTVGIAGLLSKSILYHVGFCLVSIGGPVVFMSIISFSNLFPKYSGLITGLCVGCFDASSVILPVIGFIYTNFYNNFSSLFLMYSIIPLIATFVPLMMYPTKAFQLEMSRNTTLEEHTPVRRVSIYSLDKFDLKYQLKSPEFWLTVYTVSIYMLRINFFIQTIGEQTLFNKKENVMIFGYMLPAAGICFIPVIGYISDHRGILTAWSTLWIVMFIFGVLDLITENYKNYMIDDIIVYVRYFALVFTRPCLYSFTQRIAQECLVFIRLEQCMDCYSLYVHYYSFFSMCFLM
eukprot:UN30347